MTALIVVLSMLSGGMLVTVVLFAAVAWDMRGKASDECPLCFGTGEYERDR